jgi:uroporphyrinogen-III synthase
MKPLLFLTRLDPLDDGLAAKASGLGYSVLRIPVLATDPGSDGPSLAERLATLGAGTAIVWTSRRAAGPLAHALAAGGAKGPFPRMYTLGDESAAPVRDLGCTPFTPASPARAADLARFIAGRAAEDGIRRVLFLRGDRSLPDLPSGLESAGIEVTSLEVYRTRFIDADVSGLTASLQREDAIVGAFFSPSTVTGLERLLDSEARERLRARATVIARGPTTTSVLKALGYQSIYQPYGKNGIEPIALSVLESAGVSR